MTSPLPATFNPDWRLHPGEVLSDVLAARGIRQSELATRTGLSAKHINQIVKQSIGISGDVAMRLELALNVPATFWTQVDAAHAAFKSREEFRKNLPELIKWTKAFDRLALRRYGIVEQTDSPEAVAEKLLSFFGVAGIGPFERTWLQPNVSFRRSQSYAVEEQNTALWLKIIDQRARQRPTPPLSLTGVRKVARQLPELTTLPLVDGMNEARKLLFDVGVNVLFQAEIPKTRVCGATWWVDGDHPTIGLTERHRREDMLWFALMHELGHIQLHPKRKTFLNLEGDKAGDDGAEAEADDYARGALLPAGGVEAIAAAASREDLARLAVRFGIGASIVAGCHGRITKDWRTGSPLRRSVTDQELVELEQLS